MKTFREYLNECRFEDIWHSIVENLSESEGIKPVYAEYFEKLKELPHKPVKGIIDLSGESTEYPDGMNGAPDWLIDKKVKTSEKDSPKVAATLLYWASLHTFYTSQEHDADLFKYLEIINSQDGKALCDYMTESMKPKPYRAEIEESRERKKSYFGKIRFRAFIAEIGVTPSIFLNENSNTIWDSCAASLTTPVANETLTECNSVAI